VRQQYVTLRGVPAAVVGLYKLSPVYPYQTAVAYKSEKQSADAILDQA
jgi:hypothetical protein